MGLITGYAGGLLDAIVQRVVDAFMCFPLLLVALTIMALLGPGLANVVLTLGLVLAVRDSRVVRGTVLGVKANLYVSRPEPWGPRTRASSAATCSPTSWPPCSSW